MIWIAPKPFPQLPSESDEDYWERIRAAHNDVAAKFNKDWFNRLFRLKIALMPSHDEVTKQAMEAYRDEHLHM